MTTGILILNYNNSHDTIHCIESVMKYTTAKIKFIIVDNASPKPSCVPEIHEWLKNHFKSDYLKIKDGDEIGNILPITTFILSSENDGYAKGNNIGLKYIYNDLEIDNILVLNNDILFIEDIIPGLTSFLESIPDAGIVSPLLLKKNRREIDYNCARRDVNIASLSLDYLVLKKQIFPIQRKQRMNQYYFKTNPNLLEEKIVEVQLPSGSCMLLKKDFFKEIKGFDPRTFLYYEENILHKKVSVFGKKIYLNTSLKCIHLGASSISQSSRNYEFDRKCDQSASIYINNYSGASSVLKFLFNIAFRTYSINKFLIHKIKKLFSFLRKRKAIAAN